MVSFVAQPKSVIKAMFQNSTYPQHCVPSTCSHDGVGYGILQSILGRGWCIDAFWLNTNDWWCNVCQGGPGCNLSTRASQKP